MSAHRTPEGLRVVAVLVVIAAIVGACAGCGVGWEGGYVAYPEGPYGGCMNDAFIATAEPIYYNGQASYLCGGAWYYRNGPGWGRYGVEPGELRTRRLGGGPGRRVYEGSRGGARGGTRGGGRGGGRR